MTVLQRLCRATIFRSAVIRRWYIRHTTPEITADSPADLGPEGERLAREERWL